MAENTFAVDRELAGGAKNILDDLRELDRKIPQELERGVREGYLESGKVVGLAEKLGVQPPRIRTHRWVYVEHRQIQSVAVDAYDDEDAIRIVNDSYGRYLRRGEIPGGFRRSHWAGWGTGPQDRLVSEPTTQRPGLDHDLRFYVDRQGEPRSLRQPATAEPAETTVENPAMSISDEAFGTQIHELAERVVATAPRIPIVLGPEAEAALRRQFAAQRVQMPRPTWSDDEPF